MAIIDFFRKKEEAKNSLELRTVFVDGIRKVSSHEKDKEAIVVAKETEEGVSLHEKEGSIKKEKVETEDISLTQSGNAPAQNVSPYSEDARQIETILEEGLSQSYDALPPGFQEEFRVNGEKTALKIAELLRGAKIKMKKIFDLIRSWLRMLPGVSQLFIEQEARNKTKKILEMREKQEKNNFS